MNETTTKVVIERHKKEKIVTSSLFNSHSNQNAPIIYRQTALSMELGLSYY